MTTAPRQKAARGARTGAMLAEQMGARVAPRTRPLPEETAAAALEAEPRSPELAEIRRRARAETAKGGVLRARGGASTRERAGPAAEPEAPREDRRRTPSPRWT